MYTLTRKLSVVCLTVVLSFLVYGCGGSSKQALITDVSTDMVTAGLTPDSGTYTIQPGGTANAGDVTFSCPAEGAPCEVTVAEDGTITSPPGSAPGMATAMDSASAAARLAAEQRATDAEAAQMAAENMRDAAVTAQTDAEQRATDAEAARDAAVTARTDAENMRDAAVTARTDAENMRDAAVTARTDAENMRDAAVTARTDAENMRDAAVTARMDAENMRDAAVTARTDAENMRDAEVTARMDAEQRATDAEQRATDAEQRATDAENMRDAAVTAQTDAEQRATDAEAAQMAAENMRNAAVTAQTDAEQRATDAEQRATDAENMRNAAVTAQTDAEKRATDAEAARDAAEKEARLLTTVTPIDPDLAPDYRRVAKTDIYKVEPGDTKAVPNSDVEINCPLEGGVRCTVVVAVNDDGVVTYTSLGGVATVANTGSVLHTRMAIALFSPDDAGEERTTGGLNAEADPAADGPPTDDMIGVARSVDGRTTTFTLTHDADATDEVKYTDDKPVDIGHGITGWIGRTLKRDNGGEDSTATREDEGTFYTNIERAKPGKWKVSGTDVLVTEMAFAVDPDQVLSNEDGATFTGAYIRADGTEIPGTYTCTTTTTTCTAVGELATSLESQRLILAAQLAEEWKFESDNNVKEGDVADKDYMYFGYWLQEPVKQSDLATAYKFRAYSGGPDVFSVAQALLNEEDDLTANYKGGAAGRYVTRKLEIKDEITDDRSPGYHGRFTATAELTAYFGAHPNFDEDVDANLPDRKNMLGGSITKFKDGGRDLDFEVTLVPIEIVAGMDVMEGTTAAKFGETDTSSGSTGAGDWEANFYGPNAAAANEPATNTTLPSGVAGKFDANSKYTKVIGAFAAGKQ